MSYPPPRDPTGPGQRSVWDFPRPPALEQRDEEVEVRLGGVVVARCGAGTPAGAAWTVLETSHPPTWYLPRAAFAEGVLRPAAGSSYCEWKGVASYLDLVGGPADAPVVAERAAWTYPDPVPAYAVLRDHVALYASAVDACRVDGTLVVPQPGGFYAGWITPDVTGPFKGIPGSLGW